MKRREKYVVQKLIFALPPSMGGRAALANVKLGRVWRNIAVCDRLATAERVMRNVRIDGEEIVRIRKQRVAVSDKVTGLNRRYRTPSLK